jgi:uncharacterized membrane protein
VNTPNDDPPRREFAFREALGGFSLTLKRNCSMSPAGLLIVFAALSIAALAIGIGFAILGAWLILPFAGVEVLLLGAAFALYSRRAADCERIELARDRLTVEVTQSGRTARYERAAAAARVIVEKDDGYGARVWLHSGAREPVEIGRYLDAHARATLAAELAKKLRII